MDLRILRDGSRILLGNLSEALYIRVWTGRPRQEACERYRSLELLGETSREGKRNNNKEAMIHFMIFIFKLVTSIRVTRGFPVILIGFVGILTGASTWSAEETVDLPRYSGDRFRCRLDSIGYTFGGIVRDGGSGGGADISSSTLESKSRADARFSSAFSVGASTLRVLIWAFTIVIKNWKDARERELA